MDKKPCQAKNNFVPVIFDPVQYSKLTKGQQVLLETIQIYYGANMTIDMDDIIDMYKKNVQRYKKQSYKGCNGWVERDYFPWEIEDYALRWLTRSLGILIRKGFLLIMPRIDFRLKQKDPNK
jgi:hypothetical protein